MKAQITLAGSHLYRVGDSISVTSLTGRGAELVITSVDGNSIYARTRRWDDRVRSWVCTTWRRIERWAWRIADRLDEKYGGWE